jgi:uncharacterized protein YceH (UPF0502 family)
MAIELDPTERRIVGALIEKQLSVPESYPLTLNALVLACNQKNNREPETQWAEFLVQGALRALMNKEWAIQMEREGSRTPRFSHQAKEQLGVDEHDLALLAELLLRGPQSAPELKTRASRMRPFGTVEEVDRRLDALSSRPVPYVRYVGKRPGERVGRWEHRLGGEGESTVAEPALAPASATPARPEPAPMPATAAASKDPFAEMLARLERLEREVARLRDALGA